ncbi:unnamed protein product [Penicillium egyptiacum]|uniref:LysM domain-containing protein n=1 Tax=Penicillium egyptiacum TaxID=1303716 RepID=A0A9W4P885_9EURO|nr:unnamed protein product [Penicillium egyptiacum]
MTAVTSSLSSSFLSRLTLLMKPLSSLIFLSGCIMSTSLKLSWSHFLELGILLNICLPFVSANAHGHWGVHDRRHQRDAVSSTALPTAKPSLATTETIMLSSEVVSGPTALFDINYLTMFSADCASALGASLNCSDLIQYSDYQQGLTVENLTALCTTACSSSIATFRENVFTNCANDIYTDEPVNASSYVYGTGTKNDIYNVEGISIKPIAMVDPYFINYDMTCMQDGANPPNFCYTLAANDTGTEVEPDPCGNCGLGIMRVQLDSPVGYFDQFASQYLASASSCGVTVPPLSKPTQVYLNNTNTLVSSYASTPTCTGIYVTITPGSTCDEFAESNSISTDQLLMINGLAGGCANWPGNLDSLCVEGNCEPYLVQQNDTCRSVAAAHNITLTQLLSWNPTIDPKCTNWQTKIDHVICVGNPVGYVQPTSTSEATTTAIAVTVPTNAVDGSNVRCAKWYTAGENGNLQLWSALCLIFC